MGRLEDIRAHAEQRQYVCQCAKDALWLVGAVEERDAALRDIEAILRSTKDTASDEWQPYNVAVDEALARLDLRENT